MKVIKYQFLSAMVDDEPYFIDKTIPYSEESEELAKAEAYNSEYTIEDDGKQEPSPTSSSSDSAVWEELDLAYINGINSL